MEKEALYEKIEAYLNGTLPAEEQHAFEKAMQEDATLRQEVQLHRELAATLTEEDVMDLSAKLNNILKDQSQITEARRRFFVPRRPLLIAASIALVLFAGWLVFILIHKDTTSASLYAQYVDLPTALDETVFLRSASGSVEKPIDARTAQLNEHWQAVNQAYIAGNYNQALTLLEQFKTLYPDFIQDYASTYYYNKGLIQLQLDQPEEAANSFARVTTGNYTEDALWKRAMALLLLEDRRVEAKKILQSIRNSPNPRQKEAKKLLNNLSK